MHQQIISNKRKTVMFLFLVALLVGAVGFFVGEIVGQGDRIISVLFFGIALFVSVLSSFVSYFYSDRMVLKMAGAIPVDKNQEPYLYNTIEGVAMAAGIPTPKMYIIENPVPNAFATGRNPEHGVVAVTRGLLNILNREELEGVIAHEIAHIKNYDVLYATILTVVVGVLVFISRMATRTLFYSGGRTRNRKSSSQKGGQNIIFVIIGIVFIIVAPIFAQMIQFSMSRNREYLADASAASFLGYPLGLASALNKLREKNTPQIAKANAFDNNAITALCIINPLKSNKVSNIFSTHPPLEERIQRLKQM